ncbi:hypothetical protein ILUMI_22570 [Ignelater luminosus]|uniref:Uncharacterized protein n=1 Tax=Ignelater luminosus TaxID=2038154 RepID=A0A8K0G2S4_IGNLU|nr:hypothetical protein ILUMI_22570 [Ignelater luminosus]
MEQFSGKKFKLIYSDNADIFMRAAGIDLGDMTKGLPIPTTVEVKKFHDTYVLITASPYKTIMQEFQSGNEFTVINETEPNEVKATITVTEHTLHEVLKFPSGRIAVADYIFTENDMRIILNIDFIVAKLIYKRQT